VTEAGVAEAATNDHTAIVSVCCGQGQLVSWLHPMVVVVVCGGDVVVVVVVDDDVVDVEVVAGWDGSTVVGEASSRSGATTMARSGLGAVDGVAAIVVLVWSRTTSRLNAVAGGLGSTLSLLGGAAMASIAGSVGPLVSIRVGSPIAC
jgi:hypothetical protein